VTATPPFLVIANSGAGTADRAAVDAAVGVLRAEAEVAVHSTSSPEELDDVLGDAGDRRIVVAGGDGSLHAVVAALHRRGELGDHELALLPLGTGNDFARTLGIPLDPEAAARLVLAGTARWVDLLVDDADGIVVNSVHLGAGAAAGLHGARWKKRLGASRPGRLNLGRLGYPIGALRTALRPPALRLRVEVDGRVVNDLDERVLMVVLGNGASVGGGTPLAPDADPGDGRIDVLVATPETLGAKVRYAAGVMAGRHPEHEDVRSVRGRAVTVSGSEFRCSADGELSEPVRRRAWRLAPAAYRVVAPAGRAR
jgi:diacylglycerol kinase (ATP)